MISSEWEMPENSDPQVAELNDNLIKINQTHHEIQSALDKILSKINKKILEQQHNQLPLFDDPQHQPSLLYQPNGKIPFPAQFDLDDKYVSLHADPSNQEKGIGLYANASNQEKIDDLLSKYGIVCPGAESVDISKDISDPLVTVITIKKTFF